MLVKDKVEVDGPRLCDRCGARAMSISTKEGHMLLFCGHHARNYEPKLAEQGFTSTEIAN
jgi:hypothetical protein